MANLSHIRTFGWKAYAYVEEQKQSKLDKKATERLLLDYDNKSKRYKIHTDGNKIIISRTGKFFENGINNIHEIKCNTQTSPEMIEININNDAENQNEDQQQNR